jgi:hypothetical protein
MKVSIVISFYWAREKLSLKRLLYSLSEHQSNIIVIVNSDEESNPSDFCLPFPVIFRHNLGMNIGAWHAGFLSNQDADLYIFLQDECFLCRPDFISSISRRFSMNPALGMLGESLNWRWAKPWPALIRSELNSFEPGHFLRGNPARRVDTYLDLMCTWGINPGATGEHLRSLIWALPGKVMRDLGGFPLGRNRGECIAAEIAVSRKVVMMGYQIGQISEAPFTFFGHAEWRPDGLSKIY